MSRSVHQNQQAPSGGRVGFVAALLGLTLLCGLAGAGSASKRGNQDGVSIDDGGLLSSAPNAELAEHLQLYGQFVGDWDVVATAFPVGKPPVTKRGEWNFRWVLEGRAIQDMFIVPARGARNAAAAKKQSYGTTLRYYDPASGAWEITYIDPTYPALFRLTARLENGEIVQNGVDADGNAYRWVFSDIHPDSFRWRAEVLQEDGKTWRKEQDFVVTRKAP